MKQTRLIPKPKKAIYLRSNENDLCPMKSEIIDWNRCYYCDYGKQFWKKWINYKKGIFDFTVKCSCVQN